MEYPATSQEYQQWQLTAEIARETPGIDPVLAAINGTLAELPSSGYLLEAHIGAGNDQEGTFTITAYGKGGLTISTPRDNRKDIGTAQATVTTHGSPTALLLVGKQRLQNSGFTEATLPNERSLAYENPPYRRNAVASHRIIHDESGNGSFLVINRAVESVEELSDAFENLGWAIGITDDTGSGQLQKALAEITKRDSFKPKDPRLAIGNTAMQR